MPQGLSPSKLKAARGSFYTFNTLNSISFVLLSGSFITLFALRLGASASLVGLLNAFGYATYFFLPLGKRLVRRRPIVENLFKPLNIGFRIFEKVLLPSQRERYFPADAPPVGAVHGEPEQERRMLIEAFEQDGTAQLLINVEGLLVAVNQMARTSFNLSLRDIGRPFHDRSKKLKRGKQKWFLCRRFISVKQMCRKRKSGFLKD